jgi:cytochrome c
MNKLIVFFLILLMTLPFYHCGSGGETKNEKQEEEKTDVNDVTKNPEYQKGLELVAKSDCFTCHKIEEQFTGPAYREVAKKYAGMSDTIVAHLAGKILKGGAGVWGQVFMTPHPTLSQEDAEAMVRYILLLKK